LHRCSLRTVVFAEEARRGSQPDQCPGSRPLPPLPAVPTSLGGSAWVVGRRRRRPRLVCPSISKHAPARGRLQACLSLGPNLI